MDLSRIRLVVSDMDGTLLNSKHELAPEFYTLFEKLSRKGISFAAASGRQYHNIRNVFESIRDEIFFIAENGAYAVHRDRELVVQEMDPHTTFGIVKEAKSVEGTFAILCGKRKAYIDDTTPFFVEHFQRYYDEYEVVPDLLNVKGDQFLKVAICDVSGAEGNVYKRFRHRMNELQIKVSGNIWLDVSHKLANKGEALKKLQAHLEVSPAETMVFGDYLNDLEMMQNADFSFAMENAHPDVKAISRYVAKSNDQGGVLEVLRQLV